MKQLYRFLAAIAVFGFCFLLNADKTTAQLPDVAPSLPNGKAATGGFRFAVIGDTGTGKQGQIAIAKRLSQVLGERPFDIILMLGDNIYSTGRASDIGPKDAPGNVPDSVSLKPAERHQ